MVLFGCGWFGVPSRIWCCLVFGVLVGFFFCVLGLVVWVCYVLFCCFGGFGLWFAFGFRCFLVVDFWGGLVGLVCSLGFVAGLLVFGGLLVFLLVVVGFGGFGVV